MLVDKLILQNIRSFLETEEISFGEGLNVFIGPNGSGKSTLIAALGSAMQDLLKPAFFRKVSANGVTQRAVVAGGESTGLRGLEAHWNGPKDRLITLKLRATAADVAAYNRMRSAWPEVLRQSAERGIVIEKSFEPGEWFKNAEAAEGGRIEISFANGNFAHDVVAPKTVGWISFLRSFEAISLVFAECHMGSLPQAPFAFFPSERSPAALSTGLSTSNQPSSRQEQFAQQRLMAAAFVRLQSDDIGNASRRLREIPELKRLETALRRFGFTWDLRETDPYSRQFSVKTFSAVIERDPKTGLFVGFVPGFPGAHSQGATLDELNGNLQEVIAMLLEDGEPRLESEFIGVQNVAVA